MGKEFLKPVFLSLSPNVEPDDLKLAKNLFFSLKKIKKGEAVSILEEKIAQIVQIPFCSAFNSGRSALFVILKALDYPEGSEIIVPGFTCNALINPILSFKLRPVYTDIEKSTLNLDLNDLRKKITPKTKAIVVQHTFGLPDNVKEINELCKQHNIDLIEDCAHSLGANINGKSVGSFGKVAFFSFGRDKIVSSVFGGIAATQDDDLARKISEIQKNIPDNSSFWIRQQLLHPILTQYLIKPLYGFGQLGRFLLIFLQKIHILSKAVSNKDKIGEFDINFVRKMPDALALLVLNQLEKLEKLDKHRKSIADIYNQELKGLNIQLPAVSEGRIFMRYPLLISDSDKALSYFRSKKVFLDDGWRKKNIVPPDTDQEKLGYIKGSCLNAEYVAEHIFNLPTGINISAQDAKNIANILKTHGNI